MKKNGTKIVEIVGIEADSFDDFESLSLCPSVQGVVRKVMSTEDQARYHTLLVAPAMSNFGDASVKALILGGGDGGAALELLRYPNVTSVCVVDPQALPIADPRASIVHQNAGDWITAVADTFNLIIVDYAVPDEAQSKAFATKLTTMLSGQGVLAVQNTFGVHASAHQATISALENHGFMRSRMPIPLESQGDNMGAVNIYRKG